MHYSSLGIGLNVLAQRLSYLNRLESLMSALCSRLDHQLILLDLILVHQFKLSNIEGHHLHAELDCCTLVRPL